MPPALTEAQSERKRRLTPLEKAREKADAAQAHLNALEAAARKREDAAVLRRRTILGELLLASAETDQNHAAVVTSLMQRLSNEQRRVFARWTLPAALHPTPAPAVQSRRDGREHAHTFPPGDIRRDDQLNLHMQSD